MKREELLRDREYWINQIQNELYGIVEKYMSDNNLSRTDMAQQLNVTKGYITQVLKGDYDHKISKLVDLSLAAGNVPLLYFVNTDKFIKDDAAKMYYEIHPTVRVEAPDFSPSNKSFSSKYSNMLPAAENMSSLSVTTTN